MNQIFLIFSVMVANWKKSKLQLVFTIMGIAVACTLWSSVDIINNQTIKAQKRSIDLLKSAFKPIIIDREHLFVKEDDFVKLRLSGWIVNPVLRTKLENTDINIMGVDLLSDKSRTVFNSNNDASVNLLELQMSDNGFLVGSRKTLEKIKGSFTNLKKIETDQLPDDILIGDIALVQKLLNLEGKFTYLEYIGRGLGSPDNIKIKNLILIDENSAGEFEFISQSFAFNIRAFGFLSFFVGMFIVYTSIGMAYDQRSVTIKVLKVIGINRIQINLCLLVELLLISIFSGSLGTFAGFFLARELLPDINSTISVIYNSPVESNIDLSIGWFLLSIIIAMLGTVLACFTAILKLDNIKPDGIRDDRKIFWDRKKTLLAGMFLILLIMAFYYLSISTDIKIVNFLFLGSIIILGSLTVPFLLRQALSFVATTLPKRYTLVYWLLKDTQRFGKLLYAAYIAFFLALSINIGVHGMVTSFKSTFISWLENRIFADYYINIANAKQLTEIEKIIKKYSGEIYPIIKNKGKHKTKLIEIYGFKAASIYEENWPLLESDKNLWTEIRDGNSIIISEQFSIREGINTGDYLELEINETTLNIKVGGVYADYGNPRNQIMMPLKLYNTFFKSQIPSTIAVKLDPSSKEAFFNNIVSNVNIVSETIINPNQVRKISLEIFDNTFKISFQLAIITLFVAAFTLYTNLISINQLRKRDLLPVYLIGLSEKNIIRLEVLKVFILTNLVSFISVGMGVIIAFILSRVINPNFFGWEIPIKVFPDYWTKMWFVATLTSILSTILSLRRSNKHTSPLLGVNKV